MKIRNTAKNKKSRGYTGLAPSGEYPVKTAAAIIIDSSRPDPFEKDGSLREIPVRFYYPETEGRFPLVVFSHGAFGYYKSNYSTYTELASRGYVVAALDHPHHAFRTKNTKNKTVRADMGFLNTVRKLNSDTDPQVLFEVYSGWMALRTADMNCAVDSIKASAEAGCAGENWFVAESERDAVLSALRLTDITKIGLMGHSLGGATSVELGRTRDDISAVIDLDGTMLGEYTGVENGRLSVREDPYTVPVLEFVNFAQYLRLPEFREAGRVYPNDVLMANAEKGYTTTIRGTMHMDFTDLPLFSPFLGKMLGSGERDTAEAMTIVNSLVRSFFDSFLKGEGDFTLQDVY